MRPFLNNTLEALLAEPAAPLEKCTPFDFTVYPPCKKITTRRVLIAIMFGFEVDTLEIMAQQTMGYADILLSESKQSHNRRGLSKKPLVWKDFLAHLTRFAAANITGVECPIYRLNNGTRDDTLWDIENMQDICLANAVRLRVKNYDIVTVGATDEVLSREKLYELKYCALPSLPQSSAIGMPMGLLGRSFRTDWHVKGYEESLSLPTVYPAESSQPFLKKRAAIGNKPFVGGLHMTNYCFLPASVMKDLTATEYGGASSRHSVCAKTLESFKNDCYKAWTGPRLRNGWAREAVVPCALQSSPARYPAWYGSIDQREQVYWDKMCGRS